MNFLKPIRMSDEDFVSISQEMEASRNAANAYLIALSKEVQARKASADETSMQESEPEE